jgi:hypothetical protein
MKGLNWKEDRKAKRPKATVKASLPSNSTNTPIICHIARLSRRASISGAALKVFFDQDIPRKLARSLPRHEIQTVVGNAMGRVEVIPGKVGGARRANAPLRGRRHRFPWFP